MSGKKSALDEVCSYYARNDIKSWHEWVTIFENARAELAQLRADLERVTSERDAFAAESDAVHRAINEMCGTDTSTIDAVQHVIEERDAWRTIAKIESDTAIAMRDEVFSLKSQLVVYQRREELRQ